MKLNIATFLLITVFTVNLVCGTYTDIYDKYRVYTIKVSNDYQLNVLKEIEKNPDGFTFWDFPASVNSNIKIQVPPNKRSHFGEIMNALEMEHTIFIEDLQIAIDNVQPRVMPKVNFGWDAYYKVNDINQWLDSLAEAYPKIVTKIVGGSTYEGRKIEGIKISYKEGNKGIFIEGGIHAREWITPAATTFMANELLTSDDMNIRHYAENFDWYIFPSVNPDGYEWTRTNRLWRKNRAPHGILCKGVDLNRNWEYGWNEGGVSSNPCSDVYNGPSPFSEVETNSLSKYYLSVADKISIYVAFHSYAQVLMIPFGNTYDHLANYDEAMEVGKVGIEKMKERYGTDYKLGSIPDIMYIASGGSIDWVKGAVNTSLSYVYELRDKGKYGFLLPANQIIPTGEETLDSVCGLLSEVEKRDL